MEAIVDADAAGRPTVYWLTQEGNTAGRILYDKFLALLQVSRVHVYLTYPFVLSWSLLEAMACEAAIVASDTPPVREVLTHGETGRLTDFFDQNALVDEVCHLLENAEDRQALGRAARDLAQSQYDLQTICLPRQLDWVKGVLETKLVSD